MSGSDSIEAASAMLTVESPSISSEYGPDNGGRGPRPARTRTAGKRRSGRKDSRQVACLHNSSGYADYLYNFPAPGEQLLQQRFGLSPAETRLARIIARGEPLELAARSLGIKLATARSQLGAIFLKTNTGRQPQLVALLSRLAHLHPSL